MKTLQFGTESAWGATRVLLLPPAYSTPADAVASGFAAPFESGAVPLQLEIVDLQLEHLLDRDALRRLREEVILPARATGCGGVWLVGISLGGYAALLYALRHASDLAGVGLIAPFLGNRSLWAQIERAGGLASWQDTSSADDDDEDRRLWRFLKDNRDLPLLLGYGAGDRFAAGHRVAGGARSIDNPYVVPGGHDWPTWREIWGHFLRCILR